MCAGKVTSAFLFGPPDDDAPLAPESTSQQMIFKNCVQTTFNYCIVFLTSGKIFTPSNQDHHAPSKIPPTLYSYPAE